MILRGCHLAAGSATTSGNTQVVEALALRNRFHRLKQGGVELGKVGGSVVRRTGGRCLYTRRRCSSRIRNSGWTGRWRWRLYSRRWRRWRWSEVRLNSNGRLKRRNFGCDARWRRRRRGDPGRRIVHVLNVNGRDDKHSFIQLVQHQLRHLGLDGLFILTARCHHIRRQNRFRTHCRLNRRFRHYKMFTSERSSTRETPERLRLLNLILMELNWII